MSLETKDVALVAIQVISLLIATIGHEIMHGLVALMYGDDTARKAGRLSINPIPHIDLLGTIILPLILIVSGSPVMFGYAKPVPVDMSIVYKNGGYRACSFVALGGVFFNFFLAFCCVLILKISVNAGLVDMESLVAGFFLILVFVNVVIGVFNLLPIPPLDGSKALVYISLMLKSNTLALLYDRAKSYGIIVILLMLLFPPTREGLLSIMRLTIAVFLKI